MVFDDHTDAVGLGEFREAAQAIGGELDLLIVGAAAAGVDPDGVTAEIGGGLDPPLMLLDGPAAARLFRISKGAFAVDHDQDAVDALSRGALLHLGEVLFILCLVLEELVDVFDSVDPQGVGGFCEVEIVELL